ncbi:hypothetical protein BD779DRAFT_1440294, partial [Infundibulicybe gibba]
RQHSATHRASSHLFHIQCGAHVVGMVKPLPKISLEVDIAIRAEYRRIKVVQ